jgi:hypothetical protein
MEEVNASLAARRGMRNEPLGRNHAEMLDLASRMRSTFVKHARLLEAA